MTHPCELPDEVLLRDCDVRRQRRSGPGGQHRNKVETAIVLLHRATAVQAEASERRSQHENQRVALRRLRVNLALEVRMPRLSSLSELWLGRCENKRIRINLHHDDFPALLAEALDVVSQAEYDIPQAADALGVSSSQLIRFLKLEHRALLHVNQQRQQRGLRTLK